MKNTMLTDPVHEGEKGWYFWDETWTDAIGPYISESHARESCLAYGQFLQDGKTEDPHLMERHRLQNPLP